jgi:hypothetical protein
LRSLAIVYIGAFYTNLNLEVDKHTCEVNLSSRLIKHCHKCIRGSGGVAPPFLTWVLDGGEWSA